MPTADRAADRAADPGSTTERDGTERLVLFTDAVAAIAITLLVLPLVELLAEPESAEEPLGDLLGSHLASFGAFVLGFALIARFWWAHHQLFRKVQRVSGALVWCNFLWILAVVVLPVTTQVITAYAPSPGTVALYSTVLVLAAGSLTAMAVVVHRTPRLLAPGATVRPELLGVGVTFVLLVLALVVGTVFAGTVNYFAYFLLLLSGGVEHLVRRRWPAAGATA